MPGVFRYSGFFKLWVLSHYTMEKSDSGEKISTDRNARGQPGSQAPQSCAVMFATLPTIKSTLRVPLNESTMLVQHH